MAGFCATSQQGCFFDRWCQSFLARNRPDGFGFWLSDWRSNCDCWLPPKTSVSSPMLPNQPGKNAVHIRPAVNPSHAGQLPPDASWRFPVCSRPPPWRSVSTTFTLKRSPVQAGSRLCDRQIGDRMSMRETLFRNRISRHLRQAVAHS